MVATTESGPTQAEYEETAYEDASWEVIGERPPSNEFVPMATDVLRTDGAVADQMFEDFGGIDKSGSAKRWHLPQHLAYKPVETAEMQQEQEQILRLKEEELQRLREETYQQGLAEGEAKGRAAAATEIQAIKARNQALVRDLQGQVRDYLEDVVKQSVDLALQVSKKIIGTAVEVNPEYIIPLIREALHKTGGAVIRSVRVSPEDFEFIEFMGEAQISPEFDGSWRFEKDETIRSGCVVETSSGTVDYQLDTAWARVREQVVKVIA